MVYKPIKRQLLLKPTILFVCFRPLTTFNRPDITICLRRILYYNAADFLQLPSSASLPIPDILYSNGSVACRRELHSLLYLRSVLYISPDIYSDTTLLSKPSQKSTHSSVRWASKLTICVAASSHPVQVSRPVLLKSCLRAAGSGSTSKSVSFPDNYLTKAGARFYELNGLLLHYLWMDPYFRRQFGSWPHQRSISSVSPVDGKDYYIRFDGNYQEPRTTGKFGSDRQYRKRCSPYRLYLRSQGDWTPIPEISLDVSEYDYQEEHGRRSQLILCDECAEDT
jgi:hypothetical protein